MTSSAPVAFLSPLDLNAVASSLPPAPLAPAQASSESAGHLVELSLLSVCNRILLSGDPCQKFDRSSFRELLKRTSSSDRFHELSLLTDELLEQLVSLMDLNCDGEIDSQEIKCCSSVLSPVRSFEERLVLVFTAYDVDKSEYFAIPLLFDLLAFVSNLRAVLGTLDAQELLAMKSFIADLQQQQGPSLWDESQDDRPGFLSREQFLLVCISDDRIVRLLSGTAVDRAVAPINRARAPHSPRSSTSSPQMSSIERFARQSKAFH